MMDKEKMFAQISGLPLHHNSFMPKNMIMPIRYNEEKDFVYCAHSPCSIDHCDAILIHPDSVADFRTAFEGYLKYLKGDD